MNFVIWIARLFIPFVIRRKVVEGIFLTRRRRQIVIKKSLPQINLENKHLKNAILLPSRIELLKYLPKNGTVAELGVLKGDYAQKISDITQPKKLYLIDMWDSENKISNEKARVQERFSKEIDNKSIQIEHNTTVAASNNFPDYYFDWIYIDASHVYEAISNDLEAYQNKIKHNGIIAGHDFTGWDSWGVKYGVVEAVAEFCCKYDWEIIYLTIDTSPSFAIRRMVTGDI